MPNVKDTIAAKNTPIKVSCKVNGNALAINEVIGCSGGVVTPKSKTSTLPIKRKYCTSTGSFKPCCSRYNSFAASLALSPNATEAGSPGVNCKIIKTNALTPSIISGNAIKRRSNRRSTISIFFSDYKKG